MVSNHDGPGRRGHLRLEPLDGGRADDQRVVAADGVDSGRREVEVELRSGTTVRHVWVDEVDGLAVGQRVRLLDDEVADADADAWWTVERVHGRRRVPSRDGLAMGCIGVSSDEP